VEPQPKAEHVGAGAPAGPTSETIASVEETVNAGGSSLSYDALTGIYTYVWKTDKGWANSCRELHLMLNDGEVYKARFTMRK